MFEWEIGLESLSADLWAKGTCGVCFVKRMGAALLFRFSFLIQILSVGRLRIWIIKFGNGISGQSNRATDFTNFIFFKIFKFE